MLDNFDTTVAGEVRNVAAPPSHEVVDDRDFVPARQQQIDKVRADKAAATSYEVMLIDQCSLLTRRAATASSYVINVRVQRARSTTKHAHLVTFNVELQQVDSGKVPDERIESMEANLMLTGFDDCVLVIDQCRRG